MSAKFTPGPWTIKYSGDNGLPLIEPDHARADDPIIAKCYARRADADAHLIAAAPDLLAIVERVALLTNEGDDRLLGCAYVDGDPFEKVRAKGSFLELIETARAVLAKVGA